MNIMLFFGESGKDYGKEKKYMWIFLVVRKNKKVFVLMGGGMFWFIFLVLECFVRCGWYILERNVKIDF